MKEIDKDKRDERRGVYTLIGYAVVSICLFLYYGGVQ